MGGLVEKIKVSSEIYSKEAVLNTAYNFLGDSFIKIDTVDGDFIVEFKKKKGNNLEQIIDNFNKELIDQQVRENINNKFSNIREMIVKKAFMPIEE